MLFRLQQLEHTFHKYKIGVYKVYPELLGSLHLCFKVIYASW
jgi:hypothetical protein